MFSQATVVGMVISLSFPKTESDVCLPYIMVGFYFLCVLPCMGRFINIGFVPQPIGATVL